MRWFLPGYSQIFSRFLCFFSWGCILQDSSIPEPRQSPPCSISLSMFPSPHPHRAEVVSSRLFPGFFAFPGAVFCRIEHPCAQAEPPLLHFLLISPPRFHPRIPTRLRWFLPGYSMFFCGSAPFPGLYPAGFEPPPAPFPLISTPTRLRIFSSRLFPGF